MSIKNITADSLRRMNGKEGLILGLCAESARRLYLRAEAG